MDRRGWEQQNGDWNRQSGMNGTQPQQPLYPQEQGTPYPFEEPVHSPELVQERSSNVYHRTQPFWSRVGDTGQVEPPQERRWSNPESISDDEVMEIPPVADEPPIAPRAGAGALAKLLLVVVIAAVAAVLVCGWVFKVRSIVVTGNVTVSAEEIRRLSGLEEGMSIMSVNDEEVMARIERHRYLRCTLVDVRSDQVIINVVERQPVVMLRHNGMEIVLDNRGWVLDEYMNSGLDFSHLILASGMDIRRATPGQAIRVGTEGQLEAYTELLIELKAMGSLDAVKELDMSSMDSIYLVTRDGYDVRIGNEELIHEKLRAMLVVRESVRQMGYAEGAIDVSDPYEPTYAKSDKDKALDEKKKNMQ